VGDCERETPRGIGILLGQKWTPRFVVVGWNWKGLIKTIMFFFLITINN